MPTISSQKQNFYLTQTPFGIMSKFVHANGNVQDQSQGCILSNLDLFSQNITALSPAELRIIKELSKYTYDIHRDSIERVSACIWARLLLDWLQGDQTSQLYQKVLAKYRECYWKLQESLKKPKILNKKKSAEWILKPKNSRDLRDMSSNDRSNCNSRESSKSPESGAAKPAKTASAKKLKESTNNISKSAEGKRKPSKVPSAKLKQLERKYLLLENPSNTRISQAKAATPATVAKSTRIPRKL